ncbi:MAG: hypothetical protein ACXWJK_01490 [Burkholderiaceae bacterium]
MLVAHAESETNDAGVLRAQYDSLKEQLQHNQFKRQLVLDSTEAPDRLKGSIYAVVDYPFSAVRAGLNNPDHWCDVLLLHMNTKYCRAETKMSGTILNVNIGKKTPEDLADSKRLAFNYKVAALTPDYFKIMLNAKEGPMGTSDYHIALEAVTLDDSRTFIHLTYTYATSMTGRLAMRTYLATAGSGKVGFTVVGKKADGKPDYVNGVRGLIERNTMRYYLAIDAFLSAENMAPTAQLEKRLQTWFAATERYARQLHEMDRGEYLEMKRAENMRQLSMLGS